jgi:hypothetical protein
MTSSASIALTSAMLRAVTHFIKWPNAKAHRLPEAKQRGAVGSPVQRLVRQLVSVVSGIDKVKPLNHAVGLRWLILNFIGFFIIHTLL